jgi:hypothetical protein
MREGVRMSQKNNKSIHGPLPPGTSIFFVSGKAKGLKSLCPHLDKNSAECARKLSKMVMGLAMTCSDCAHKHDRNGVQALFSKDKHQAVESIIINVLEMALGLDNGDLKLEESTPAERAGDNLWH